MSKRKQHSPEFKAKLALEALKGEETVSELASWSTDAGVPPERLPDVPEQRKPPLKAALA